ncbi:Uma2 family endonuclease [Lacihabitans sp. LS3-19]|uniref:Uma2 family endonuclease n=1 Tax=Lacihabitans sp. LS3-19 TaxID=2487335 RepID=UPI0020CD724C|nr:Uma2 family endonuclease [Lacihabitans sp. LS3-19]MCP9766412.1 Uma2 family endonuclease [Lacihabitans sp. LS3-19]
MITDINLLDFSKKYSFADYLTWSFSERIELLKGLVFKMSPAPNTTHQRVSWELSGRLYNYFKNKDCQTFSAPFDVRLPKGSAAENEIFTVVQPDLCVICDPNKIDERGCIGAPDLVIEILSPGNTTKEMKNKFEIYEEAGVREYWLVEPNDKVVLIYILVNGKYQGLAPVTEEDILKSTIFEGLEMPLKEIFFS